MRLGRRRSWIKRSGRNEVAVAGAGLPDWRWPFGWWLVQGRNVVVDQRHGSSLASTVQRLALAALDQVPDQVDEPGITLAPVCATARHCRLSSVQHQRHDVIDVIEDVLITCCRHAKVSLVLDERPRKLGTYARELGAAEFENISHRHGGS